MVVRLDGAIFSSLKLQQITFVPRRIGSTVTDRLQYDTLPYLNHHGGIDLINHLLRRLSRICDKYRHHHRRFGFYNLALSRRLDRLSRFNQHKQYKGLSRNISCVKMLSWNRMCFTCACYFINRLEFECLSNRVGTDNSCFQTRRYKFSNIPVTLKLT